MPYDIVMHELAVNELEALRVFDQRRILAEIRGHLADRPTVPTQRVNVRAVRRKEGTQETEDIV